METILSETKPTQTEASHVWDMYYPLPAVDHLAERIAEAKIDREIDALEDFQNNVAKLAELDKRMPASGVEREKLARSVAQQAEKLARMFTVPVVPAAPSLRAITALKSTPNNKVIGLGDFVRRLCPKTGGMDFEAVAGTTGVLYLPRLGLTLGVWLVDIGETCGPEVALTVLRCNEADIYSRRAARAELELARARAHHGFAGHLGDYNQTPSVRVLDVSFLRRTRLLGLSHTLREMDESLSLSRQARVEISHACLERTTTEEKRWVSKALSCGLGRLIRGVRRHVSVSLLRASSWDDLIVRMEPVARGDGTAWLVNSEAMVEEPARWPALLDQLTADPKAAEQDEQERKLNVTEEELNLLDEEA